MHEDVAQRHETHTQCKQEGCEACRLTLQLLPCCRLFALLSCACVSANCVTQVLVSEAVLGPLLALEMMIFHVESAAAAEGVEAVGIKNAAKACLHNVSTVAQRQGHAFSCLLCSSVNVVCVQLCLV